MLPQFDGVDNKVVLDDGTTAWIDDTGRQRVRFGFDALRDLARKLCRLVQKFAPLIRRTFAENQAVLMALDVALVACEFLDSVFSPLSEGVDISLSSNIVQENLAALQSIVDKYSTGGV